MRSREWVSGAVDSACSMSLKRGSLGRTSWPEGLARSLSAFLQNLEGVLSQATTRAKFQPGA
jgi:hypothetical protein